MSGINLLFRAAIAYERTHQVAIYTLLSESKFPTIWLGLPKDCEVGWEPERQLFDIFASAHNQRVYIELKTWSSLTDYQINRQLEF